MAARKRADDGRKEAEEQRKGGRRTAKEKPNGILKGKGTLHQKVRFVSLSSLKKSV
jgi:hypothetical protein